LTIGRPNRVIASSPGPGFVHQQVEWLMERSAQAVMLTDPTGLIEYVNPAFQTLSGYARSEAIGQTPAILKSGLQSRETFERLWSALHSGGEFDEVLVNRRKSGEIYHQEQTIRPLFDPQGRVTHFLASGRDVSERIATIERLTRAATHDSLTDLPNRALFLDRLDQALSQARRSGEGFAIALLDVDRFKAVNDSLGHAAGDAILRAVAQRLRHCVREVDTVARLGGDEFGLLLPGAVDAASAAHALRKIVAAFAADDGLPAVAVSVGACLGTATDADGRVLLALADDAMYFAKRHGGNAFHLCRCDRHVGGLCR
jgi:diguanylate cyclase (GGDEF)-like protein/PAS domain S-box-containing protein